jgi:hypothetical protein
MASSINASTSGGGGVIVSSDATGNLDLQSGGSTVASVSSTGMAVTGTGKFATTIGVGNATPAASGAGITFPATQSASSDANTLDDYEEGTWTPVLTFATPGNLSVAYLQQVGIYTKIGNTVTVSFAIRTSTFTHSTASGALNVTGLPFTSVTVTNLAFYGGSAWRGITKANYTDLSAEVGSNLSLIGIVASGSGQVWTSVDAADMPTSGTVILRFTITYQTA